MEDGLVVILELEKLKEVNRGSILEYIDWWKVLTNYQRADELFHIFPSTNK